MRSIFLRTNCFQQPLSFGKLSLSLFRPLFRLNRFLFRLNRFLFRLNRFSFSLGSFSFSLGSFLFSHGSLLFCFDCFLFCHGSLLFCFDCFLFCHGSLLFCFNHFSFRLDYFPRCLFQFFLCVCQLLKSTFGLSLQGQLISNCTFSCLICTAFFFILAHFHQIFIGFFKIRISF